MPNLLIVYLANRRQIILTILGVSTVLAALGLYRSHTRCAARNAVFRAEIERLKSDASDQLSIGVDKTQLARFFAEHHIQVSFEVGEAWGSLQTTGCAPFVCGGGDRALIQIHVPVDAQGTVSGHPRVMGIYTDCL